MKTESNGLGSLYNDKAQARMLHSVQRERLNDSGPRWWICESLDIIYNDRRNLGAF